MLKKLIKYTVSASIIAAMIHTTPAFANPVTQGQINATQVKIDNAETKIQQLDDRIALAMEKSQKLNDEIKTQQEKIEETKGEIVEAQKSLDTHKEVYSERLKSIQYEGKQSIATYAELLVSSDNISEFLTRFTAISNILESDTDLLNGLNEKEQALKNAEEKLNTEYDQLKKSQDQLAIEQNNIKEDKKEIENELAAAKTTLASQKTQLAEQEAEEARQRAAAAAAAAEAEQARQRAQQAAAATATPPTPATQPAKQTVQPKTPASSAPAKPAAPAKSTTPTVSAPPASSGSASAVIAYAKKFLGVPYVWGGSTPSGFDCSGFTSYVFRNAAGINLPRVSRDQQNVGTRISPSQVQPGDLVFRGNPAYHVGIYIGGGQYIHAPQTGDVVKIASYNPSKFSSAARVLR